MAFQISTPEQVATIITAVTGLLGAIGYILYGRYFPKKVDPDPIPAVQDENNPTLENGKMLRVYQILQDYVTVKSCDKTHDGLCEKFDMLRDEIKANRELVQDHYKDLSDDMKECRKLMHQLLTGGKE